MKEHALAAIGMCSTYNNLTACQTLGNMCVLQLYTRLNSRRTDNSDACAAYLAQKSSRTSVTGFPDWPKDMPWLYYGDNTADSVLRDTGIPTEFGRGDRLNFRLAAYRLNGEFIGYGNVTRGQLQLCRDSLEELDAAYLFGTQYSQTCSLSVDDLFDEAKYPLIFYDLYFKYATLSGPFLYPIPVRVMELLSESRVLVNQEDSSQIWRLTRRFFLVDNVAAKPQQSGQSQPVRAEFVRYARSVVLNIRSQVDQRLGKIYVPFLSVDYASVDKSALGTGKSVQVEFKVVYSADQGKFHYDLSVAMGSLSALAGCYAVMRTWAWARRAGLASIDIVSVVKLVCYGAGAISNVFLLVIFAVAIYFFVFYKNQMVFAIFIPTVDQEAFLVSYTIIAFALKCIDVFHVIASQCTIDIFFIDWERPRTFVTRIATAVVEGDEKRPDTKLKEASEDTNVSVWRTYFVANEWNEIQTYRKTSPLVTIFGVLFVLRVLGLERYASADILEIRTPGPHDYLAPDSRLFRIGLIVACFIVIGVVQWMFQILIYEKFIEDKLGNYVDLCSVSNVSVFVMAHKQFGYYIHGQSVHGTADVGLRRMYIQLGKERENLCAKRGLGVDTDQQTFMMALPTDMRESFDRFYSPFASVGGVAGTSAIVRALETYKALNRFLMNFIGRSNVEEMRYRIVNRKLPEDILDCEFDDSTIEGHFYKDDGKSFANVLFYGQELTLLTFDILLFCTVDIIWQNIVLDAFVTWIVGWILVILRDNLSRKNLARKTLIDERFLI